MSHTTTIPCSIRNIQALKTAAEKLGLAFHQDQRKFKTYGESRKCEHAIGLANSSYGFEIGVIKKATAEQEYELAFDSMDSALATIVGYECQNLLQGYGVQLTVQSMPFGWDYTLDRQQNGDLVMAWGHQ